MTHLSISDVYSDDTEPLFNGSRWVGLKRYQLVPWPEDCVIVYYDIGPDVKIGQTTVFNFENGRAEYEVIGDINGLHCDFHCRLLPGSTWRKPPPKAFKL